MKKKNRSTLWKWALAFYITAWPFALSELVTFFLIVRNEQLCAVNLRFNFAAWRSTVVVLSILAPPVVLIIEFVLNQIVFRAKHFILPVLSFVVYLGLGTATSALLQGEPLYGTWLAVQKFTGWDWEKLD